MLSASLIVTTGTIVALVSVFSVTFIPNKWIRGLIFTSLLAGTSWLSYQAGITMEFVQISSKYNRPLSFAYAKIGEDIQAQRYEEARHTASEMVLLAYISSRKTRDKNVEKIMDLLSK